MYFYFEAVSFFLLSIGTALSIGYCLVLIGCTWKKAGFFKRSLLKLNTVLFFLVLGAHLNFYYKSLFYQNASFSSIVILKNCRVQNCSVAKVVKYEFKDNFYSPVVEYADHKGNFIKQELDKTSRDYYIPKIGEQVLVRYLRTDDKEIVRKHTILFDSLKRRGGRLEVLMGIFSFVFVFLNIFILRRVKRYRYDLG